MKRVKRLFACLLALTMMLGLSATAFATEAVELSDVESVKINKGYFLKGEGKSPSETFKFEVTKKAIADSENTLENMPTIAGFDISYEKGGAQKEGNQQSYTLQLPSTEQFGGPGVYTYEIEEKPGDTAGVKYDGGKVQLIVTVSYENGNLIRTVALRKGDNKLGDGENAFENNYTANQLSISKTVEGNLGDKSKYFNFTVKLEGTEKKTYPDSYEVSAKGSFKSNPGTIKLNEDATFQLRHGDTVTIANLPKGVKYTVTEADYKDEQYITTSENAIGTMEAEAKTAAFTNKKQKDNIDTGVYLDNLPYILVFAGVLAIAAVFVVRRRRFED